MLSQLWFVTHCLILNHFENVLRQARHHQISQTNLEFSTFLRTFNCCNKCHGLHKSAILLIQGYTCFIVVVNRLIIRLQTDEISLFHIKIHEHQMLAQCNEHMHGLSLCQLAWLCKCIADYVEKRASFCFILFECGETPYALLIPTSGATALESRNRHRLYKRRRKRDENDCVDEMCNG